MKMQESITDATMAQATCGHDVPCGDIVATLAALSGVELANPTGYLDPGTTDILRTIGDVRRYGAVEGYFDFDTRKLIGLQSIDKKLEPIEATRERFEAKVAAFEKATGMSAVRGVYKPYSCGLFDKDYALFANEAGEAYVYCHYFSGTGHGMVQWGARRLPVPRYASDDFARDPFGEAYASQWSDGFNAEIDARIEKYRKADGVFAVDGLPEGTEVQVEQVESAFQFGCNIFNFDQLGDAEQNNAYRAAFMRGGLFNAATVPFYWKNLEPERGKPRYRAGAEDNPEYWKTHGPGENAWRRPSPERVLDFCDANGVSVHGHVIIYPGIHPDWVNGIADLDARMDAYDAHIGELAGFYGNRIPQWDIVNESVDRASTAMAPHDKMPWCGIAQPADYTFRCFKSAERHFPAGVRLCINDAYTGPSDNGRYPAFVAQLLGKGAKIDVIGHQMHIFSDKEVVQVASGLTAYPNHISWNVADQMAMLRQYDRLGKPVHVSEVTIPAPVSLLPRAEAEALQARLLRDNYRLWFSWPSVYRISYWNAVDSIGGEILESGFFRRDMSKKPVYHALWKLVNEEWRTKTTVRAGKGGEVTFRGFKGGYRLRWRDAAGKGRETFVVLGSSDMSAP